MPRCSHGIPFEDKCHACFKSAMASYPPPERMRTYPVELALRQPVQATVAFRTVLDLKLLPKEKA